MAFNSLRQCEASISRFASSLSLFKKLTVLLIIMLVYNNKMLANTTIAAGNTVNVSTILCSGPLIDGDTLFVYGKLTVTISTNLLCYSTVIIRGSGQILFDTKGNIQLSFSAGVTFYIEPGAPGLQPTTGGTASTGIVIGGVLIAVENNNSNNAPYSFKDFNDSQGSPFTLTSSSPICYTKAFTATLTPFNTNSDYSCKWSVDNDASISPAIVDRFSTVQTATINPTNSNTITTYTISCIIYIKQKKGPDVLLFTKTIKVTVNPAPSLAAVTQAPPPCAGPITITVTGMVPNSTNTISYTIGGAAQSPVTVNANASGNGAFNTQPLASVDNGKILSVKGISNSNGCLSTLSGKDITLNIKGSGTWLGITSNWNDPQNWCGGVPVSTSDITIPN